MCLRDLARYQEVYEKPNNQQRNWSVAASYCLEAAKIYHDGKPPKSGICFSSCVLKSMYHKQDCFQFDVSFVINLCLLLDLIWFDFGFLIYEIDWSSNYFRFFVVWIHSLFCLFDFHFIQARWCRSEWLESGVCCYIAGVVVILRYGFTTTTFETGRFLMLDLLSLKFEFWDFSIEDQGIKIIKNFSVNIYFTIWSYFSFLFALNSNVSIHFMIGIDWVWMNEVYSGWMARV